MIKNNISRTHDNSNFQNIELNLATKGAAARVVYNPKQQKEVFFSADSLNNFQRSSGTSLNGMQKLTNFIRTQAGKKSIPVSYREIASQKSKILQDIYKTERFLFDVEGDDKCKCERAVVYADAEALLKAVLELREENNDVDIKIMADGGQGMFKICMSIFPKKCVEEEIEEPASKRAKYVDGGTTSREGTLTGVQRLLMLAVVPNIKETYDNIKLLFDLIQINNIPFKFVSDFKVILIVNGQQTASSSYPSPYCFVSLDDLRHGKDDNNVSHGKLWCNKYIFWNRFSLENIKLLFILFPFNLYRPFISR